MQNINRVRRLALEGAQNTRDLGGYPADNGGSTRWGAFLRSDSPQAMTENDIETLLAYNVNTAIDLRTDDERSRNPSVLEKAPDFEVHHVSMSDQMHATNFEGDIPGSMSGLYISLLDNNAADIATIFRILAKAEKGVLFHCAVGKDRTGVVAMLLLKLAGVSNEDVVADYAITDIYMKEIFDAKMALDPHGMPAYVLRSKPESMRRSLAHLKETYQTAEDYLLQAGVTSQEIQDLRKKLLIN